MPLVRRFGKFWRRSKICSDDVNTCVSFELVGEEGEFQIFSVA